MIRYSISLSVEQTNAEKKEWGTAEVPLWKNTIAT
jgi:hypothetical protein